MRCPHCKKNGISALKKSLMYFELPIRCDKCGTQFTLHRGLLFLLVVLTSQLGLIFISITAFKEASSILLWGGVVIAFLFTLVITLILPLKKEHQLIRFKKHGT